MALVGGFDGKDLKISWTRNPANDATGQVVLDYIVQFYVATVLVRTDYAKTTNYTYYYDDMVQDQSVPSRVIEARVVERSTFLIESAPVVATFTNTAPSAPGFTVEPFTGYNSLNIDDTNINDTDLAGFFVYRDITPNSTLDPINLIYTGPERNVVDSNIGPNITYYYQVVAFDLFTDNPLNYDDFTQESVVSTYDTIEGAPTYKNTSVDFYKVATNTIGWTTGTAFKSGSFATESKTIPAGQYAWTSGNRYIYFDYDAGTVKNTTALSVALEPGMILLGKYAGGNNIYNGTKDIIVDGNTIVAGSLAASRFVTGTALITGTAQLADAVINNATILGGEITVSKTDTVDFNAQGLAMFGGALESTDYVQNVSGWTIGDTGIAEFDNVLVRNSFVEGAASEYAETLATLTKTLTHQFTGPDFTTEVIHTFTAQAQQTGIPNTLHFSYDLTSNRNAALPDPAWVPQDYPFYVETFLQQRTDDNDGGGWSNWGFVDYPGIVNHENNYNEVPFVGPGSPPDFYDFGTIHLPSILECGYPRTIQYRVLAYFYQPVGEERYWTFNNFRFKQKRIF
mgnify:CR=1 FL=1